MLSLVLSSTACVPTQQAATPKSEPECEGDGNWYLTFSRIGGSCHSPGPGGFLDVRRDWNGQGYSVALDADEEPPEVFTLETLKGGRCGLTLVWTVVAPTSSWLDEPDPTKRERWSYRLVSDSYKVLGRARLEHLDASSEPAAVVCTDDFDVTGNKYRH